MGSFKTELVTFRISEEDKEKIKKIFPGKNNSEIIRNSLEYFTEDCRRSNKGIVPLYIPIDLLNGEDLKLFYKYMCNLENKITEKVIELGYDYDFEYLKVIQDAKKILLTRICIEKGNDENLADIENLKNNINKKL